MKFKLLFIMLTLFLGLSLSSCIAVWDDPYYGRPAPPGYVYKVHKHKYYKHKYKKHKHYYKKYYDRDDDDDDDDD